MCLGYIFICFIIINIMYVGAGREADPKKDVQLKALLDIRRYTQVLLFFNSLFVVLITTISIIGAFQLQKYSALSSANINSMSLNALSITQNVAKMTAAAVPVVQNIQFSTNALAASLAENVNASQINELSSAARTEGTVQTRHLLDTTAVEGDVGYNAQFTVDDTVLNNEQYATQKMMRNMARKILEHVDEKVVAFNASAVSDFLEFLVYGVDYGQINTHFVRVLDDLEKTAHFGTLATAMLGIAAQSVNMTLPTASDLMGSFSQQQAVSNAAVASCSH